MRHSGPHGFTLLEVMLALGLTSLILVALGMTIDFHLRVRDTGRMHIEEAHLARVLLRRIADDLRATIPYTAQGGASTSGTTGTSGESGISDTSTTSTETDSSTNSQTTPGIYGDASSIQVELSRLPQPAQLLAQCTTASESVQATGLSGVKMVTYYVAGAEGAASTTGVQNAANSSDQRGLMRLEQDRAVANYQAEYGGVDNSALQGVLLAPEVAGIEFSYYDESQAQWVETWDTAQNGSLPTAVKIVLSITPLKAQRNSSVLSGTDGKSSNQESCLAYSLVVPIPAAKVTSSSSSASSGSSDTSSGGGSSGGGSSGGGSSGKSGKSSQSGMGGTSS